MIEGAFRRMTGFSEVTEENGQIIVSGVSAEYLARDMKRIWTTSKIASAMFTKVTWSDVRIPSFFGLELEYILNRMLESRGLDTSKRVIRNIIEGLNTNTWIKNISVPTTPWLDRGKLKEIIYENLLPHQTEFLNRYEATVRRYGLNGMLLSAAPGAGKAQPLYSNILTPNGWVKMGDIKIGDVVCTPNGKTAKVGGVYPQGKKDIYELTFKDGRKTRACGEHLWAFIDGGQKPRNLPPKIKTTLEMKERLEKQPNRTHFIPLTKPVEMKPAYLPLDPYVLGLLLGDGGLRYSVIFSSADEQLVKEMSARLPEDVELRKIEGNNVDYVIVGKERGNNSVWGTLVDLELKGKYSHEKAIPEKYLNGSYEQRLALIQGLMDSDGYVDVQSTVNFCSTSKVLAEQLQYLIRSVGGIARISTKTPTYTHQGEKREGRLAYRVNIRHPKPSTLFRLDRKVERCNDNGQYTGDVLKLGIASIEFVGVEEAQCIMVDDEDHLYITDDFIVTHNTITGCAIALTTNAEVVIVVCPKNAAIRVWQKTLQKEFKIPQNPYVAELDGAIQPKKKWHIFHYEALDRALELAKTIQGKKVCIILDESHNFNEIKSLRTERFLKLCKLTASKDIIWASGTPIKAMGFEAIPLLRSIDPLFSPVAEEAFRKMFGRDAKRTLDILAYRIGLISHTVPKQEVMSDKPEWETVTVKMPGSEKYTLGHLTKVMNDFINERTAYYKKNYSTYRKTYDDAIEYYRKTLTTKIQLEEFKEYQQNIAYLIRNGFDARRDGDIAVLTNRYEKEKIHPVIPQEMRKPFADAKSVIKYVDLKVRGECLGRILTKERIQCHVDMVHHINFDSMIKGVKKKTIIFTSYVKVVDETFDRLSKTYKPLRVYGDTNNELVQIVNKFEKDQTANPLITTYMSLSTAVPLVMANGIIFLNSPWRSYERDQAVARAHRIGQDTTVYCFEIVLDTGKEQNISSRSLDIMQWSRDQVDVIMGFTGDLKISVECNGFDVPMTVDYNEVLDDVLYDPDQTELVEVKPLSSLQSTDVSLEALPILYPADYLFYAKK